MTLGEAALTGEIDCWVECDVLQALTLHSPGRAVLDMMPHWLKNLKGTIREFHALASLTLLVVECY
jgi:hypothetical protein